MSTPSRGCCIWITLQIWPSPDAAPLLRRHAVLLAQPMGLSQSEAEARLTRLFQKHAEEWKNYLDALGERSFVKRWVRARQ